MVEQLEAQARYASAAASVRAARCLTSEWACAHGLDDVADDAALIVAELATNAVIHARTDFEVALSVLAGGGIRVEVRDGSTTMPLSGPVVAGSMSGRGLPLVHALATGWGVEAVAGGKGVWAEVATAGSVAFTEDTTAQDLLAMWSGFGSDTSTAASVAASPEAPPAVVVVVVADLQVGELLAAKATMKDMVRELQLVVLHEGTGEAELGVAWSVVDVGRRLDAAARDFDCARLQIRSQALLAAQGGCDRVTLELSLPAVLIGAAVRYRDVIGDVEALSRAGELLTHTEDLWRYSALRHCYLDAIITQLTAAAP